MMERERESGQLDTLPRIDLHFLVPECNTVRKVFLEISVLDATNLPLGDYRSYLYIIYLLHNGRATSEEVQGQLPFATF